MSTTADDRGSLDQESLVANDMICSATSSICTGVSVHSSRERHTFDRATFVDGRTFDRATFVDGAPPAEQDDQWSTFMGSVGYQHNLGSAWPRQPTHSNDRNTFESSYDPLQNATDSGRLPYAGRDTFVSSNGPLWDDVDRQAFGTAYARVEARVHRHSFEGPDGPPQDAVEAHTNTSANDPLPDDFLSDRGTTASAFDPLQDAREREGWRDYNPLRWSGNWDSQAAVDDTARALRAEALATAPEAAGSAQARRRENHALRRLLTQQFRAASSNEPGGV